MTFWQTLWITAIGAAISAAIGAGVAIWVMFSTRKEDREQSAAAEEEQRRVFRKLMATEKQAFSKLIRRGQDNFLRTIESTALGGFTAGVMGMNNAAGTMGNVGYSQPERILHLLNAQSQALSSCVNFRVATHDNEIADALEGLLDMWFRICTALISGEVHMEGSDRTDMGGKVIGNVRELFVHPERRGEMLRIIKTSTESLRSRMAELGRNRSSM